MDHELAYGRLQCLARLAPAAAHALRGAASTMAIHVELLASSLPPDDPALRDRQRRWIGIIEDERRRLVRLADAFVAEARVPDPADATLDAAAVVAHACTLLGPYAVDARAALELRVPSREVPVTASRDALVDAVFRCGMHALDAAPRGAAVVVALDDTARITIGPPGGPPDAQADADREDVTTTPACTPDAADVVARCAAAGVRCTAASDGGGAVRFLLELPAAARG